MIRPKRRQTVQAVLVVGAVMLLLPLVALATHQGWIDQLTEYVVMQKDLTKQGNLDLYLGQLKVAREAIDRGDWVGTYRAMNKFIDMLDAREGGIPEKVARDIREKTYQMEPMSLHDVDRDVKIHPEIKQWQDRMARQREEASKSF